MVQFSIFGIPVRVEPMFWLTIAFIGSIGSSLSDPGAFLKIALFVMAAFLSVLIHELGHALMIKKYGYPTNVVLTTMGGYATLPSGRLSRKQSFFVTAAGPAVQLVAGLLALYGASFLSKTPGMIGVFIGDFILVSIVWALFNCLPIFPMDGGQMLAAVMGPKRVKGMHMVGMVTAGIVGLLALAGSQIFIIAFMGLFFYQNLQLYKQYS